MGKFRTNTYSEYLPSNLSLTLEEMEQIHLQMITGIGNDEEAIELYQEILSQALKYVEYRTNWALWSKEEKWGKMTIAPAAIIWLLLTLMCLPAIWCL